MARYVTKVITRFTLLSCLIFAAAACKKNKSRSVPLEEVAGNEEVLSFMKTFEGRGALSDSSQPLTPERSLASFRVADDLSLKLILSEPAITQPVYITFDHRGRLWVVQYNQYPYPKDLKVMSMDQHIRATFDKVPLPPGQGPRGADRITFFEDTDQNGTYDKSTDAITGLNIATSVALGRGNIWVLNPPYLLAYPDRDDDGIPDGPPVVHLEGFGLEDTHAVANNLRWGPDGWLYGAQGSTTTANISSSVSKNVKFDGQAIWRYQPESHVFEVFAEGGGNTFDVEIDEKGRIYSGDNGTARGQYYKQGAYYVRNFGKHGALTNPYAFGFLSNMTLQGEKVRFTHAFIKYEGGSLPGRYRGKMIALNPLQRYVQLSRFEPNGSTFGIVDEAKIVETQDHWFRPVDVTLGPDGAVYIADWYDSRLSHVDPRDTWSKSNGRIYRLGNKDMKQSISEFDLPSRTNDELIAMLSNPNRWIRQQVLVEFGDRRDPSVIPALTNLIKSDNSQLALEALWAVNLSGGFNEKVALQCLRHKDPFVRLWAVRLTGDAGKYTDSLTVALIRLAAAEQHAEVRSQLAATAKRLPSDAALPIIRNLLQHDDSTDPDIPLQIWWALESKTASDPNDVLALFKDASLWRNRTVNATLLGRLIQRYAMQGDSTGFAVCAQLINQAPSLEDVKILFNGLQEGLRGRDLVSLPAVLVKALKPYQSKLTHQTLSLAIRQGEKKAISQALEIVADPKAPVAERLSYIRLFGEINEPASVPKLLGVVENNQSSPALRQDALQALRRYDAADIGQRVVKAYPDKLRADPGVRMAALSLFASRPAWAMDLMNAIDRKRQPGEDFIAHSIQKEDVPQPIVIQLRLLNDAGVSGMAARIWPEVRSGSGEEKTNRITQVSRVLQGGSGSPAPGRSVFMNTCGSCHRLFEQGGTLGPDLSGYDRKNVNDLLTNIVDPGAYIREGYAMYRITTLDGRILSGMIESKSGTTVSVKLLSGEVITLPDGEIREMRAQSSMMPENLLDALSDQQIRDLFAYLTKGS